jgi:hypothetical protein
MAIILRVSSVAKPFTMENVSKSLPPDFAAALGIEIAPPTLAKTMPFIARTEYEQAIERRLKAMAWERLAERAVEQIQPPASRLNSAVGKKEKRR